MDTFTFNGKQFYYNTVAYNNAGERAVEIPLGLDFLKGLEGASRVCEVGHVLPIYERELGIADETCARRVVVDLYEKGPGIDNCDVMELPSEEKYDAIVSISTVEHVGQDWFSNKVQGIRDREAPLKAIAKIYDLLVPSGRAFITVPFGILTDSGSQIQFSKPYLGLLTTKYGVPTAAVRSMFLRRLIARGQRWEEARVDTLDRVRYCAPMVGANAIAVIELTKLYAPFVLSLNVPPTSLKYETQIDYLRIGLVGYSRLLADTTRMIREKLGRGKDIERIIEEGYPNDWTEWLINLPDERRWIESVCWTVAQEPPGRS